MPDELNETSSFVPLTDLKLGRLLIWARRIEATEEFPADDVHRNLVAKLERYLKGEA